MIASASSPEIDLSWRMREQESQLLAARIRSARLTLLSAESGVDRAGLLTGGLLPLLRRRAGDAVGDEDRESRVVIPFLDRRVRRTGRALARIAERVVLFNAWSAAPMPALRQAILMSLPADAVTYARSDRLAPMMGELTRRFDAQFLVILDGFEQFWHPGLSLEAAEQFVDEFSEAVNLDKLRANFLLSVDRVDEPKLDALRQRIAGFDDSSLHLSRWQSVATKAPSSQAVTPEKTIELALDGALERVQRVKSAEDPGPAKGRGSETRLAAAPPVLLDAVAMPISPDTGASVNTVTPKKPRRQRPPRVPFVKPAPIDTEGVYAFIESTLTQTASDFAPWHHTEGLPSATTDPRQHGVSSRESAGGRQSMLEQTTWEGRLPTSDPGRASNLTNALVEPESPIDKWLDSAFAWVRRRLTMK